MTVGQTRQERGVTEDLSYRARDYTAFRQVMLDHLATELGDAMPTDIAAQEVALVEALAYVADYLSYHQDAVATEAYLGTARLRVSVARHARLLGYRIVEGCSARAWVQLETTADALTVPACTMIVTRIEASHAPRIARALATDEREVFETMHDVVLARARNRVALRRPPRDAVAELTRTDAGFAAGDVVVLQSRDRRSHAVRLTAASGDRLTWHDEDALAVDDGDDGPWWVLGNIVLADHGRSVSHLLPPGTVGPSQEVDVAVVELTYSDPYDHVAASRRSAQAALVQDLQGAEPQLWLAETIGAADALPARPRWRGRRCLLSIAPDERDFAVEPIDGLRVRLRFGDGQTGRRPSADWRWRLDYRTGGGERGNVGAAALAHIVFDDPRIVGVCNPLPAVGGVDPDTIGQARAAAVVPLGAGDRCITEEDYAAAARRFGDVARAGASREGATVTLAITRRGGRGVDAVFCGRLAEHLAPLAMIGDVLRIVPAQDAVM